MRILLAVFLAFVVGSDGLAQERRPPATMPATEADRRADALLRRMTEEEKQRLVFGFAGYDYPSKSYTPPHRALGSAGYVPGVPRLGIPALQQTDAGQGVGWIDGAAFARRATSLPSALAVAASWDPEVARRGGAMIGAEARSYGFNMLLAGGVNLVREPRNGRNFEYPGEDPLLAGVIAGETVAGSEAGGLITTLKHLIANPQETGRGVMSAKLAEPAARESDLLAFRIALERSDAGAVMTAYNRWNGVYTSEHDELITDILKGDWGYRGFVISDWGAVHSTAAAANAGLDQESAGWPNDKQVFFGAPLVDALERRLVSASRRDDMVRRILRTMISKGVLDARPSSRSIDFAANGAVSQAAAEAGAVLLKNEGGVLPIARTARRVAVIGAHADVGVLSGGGSGQVVGPEGIAFRREEAPGLPPVIYHASSPLVALRKRLPEADIRFASGEDRAAAAALAAASDVAIVFADQWTTESADVADLALPHDQDATVNAVRRANPRTVVVLLTGGPVRMPWADRVPAILQVWYPGTRGGEAIARLLLGEASPSGRLPVTFPVDERQLPRPKLDGVGLGERRFEVDYDIEGSDVGYRWHAREGLRPLFPFGHGLTYTRFGYSDLSVETGPDGGVAAALTVTNIGARAGRDTPQIYVDAPQLGTKAHRLAGWSKVTLAPGERRRLTIPLEPRVLASWDGDGRRWRIAGGAYRVRAGASSADLPLSADLTIAPRSIEP